MTQHTNTLVSITVALLVLLGIVIANRAKAPDEGNDLSEGPLSAQTASSSATSAPAAPTVTLRNFTLQSGQPATVDGYKFALRNVEDSRCPDGVQCIRAGEVRAFIQVEYGTNRREVVATSLGEWVSVGGRQVRITKVLPAYPTPIIGSYIVFLEARRP
jgi:hypothetical protein